MIDTMNRRPWVPHAAVTPTGLVMGAAHLDRLPNLRGYKQAAEVTTAAIMRMMQSCTGA